MLTVYKYLTSVAYALAYPWFKKKYAAGFDEIRGIYSEEKLLNNPIWVHAVSVGEVQAASPFISLVKKDPSEELNVLLSTTTKTGAQVAKQLSGSYDAHIYYPWDSERFVKRSLDWLKPRAFVTVETEIWPTMLDQLKRRGIPSFLINGRISDKSFRRMLRIPSFWRTVFSCFYHIMARDEQDLYRLTKLGVSRDKISVSGDCKIDAMIDRKNQCAPIQEFKHSRPIFIAGSTHPGEEEHVIGAFKILKEKMPGAKLIIVPRHPDRAAEVSSMASQTGKTVYFSEFDNHEFISDECEWEFLIVDKIGELFCLYSIAESAFIGGSLVPKGGQNIMEPALFGIPLCHGEYMSDFHHVSNQFRTFGISNLVSTPEEISDFWLRSMDENYRSETLRQSKSWFAENGGAAEKNWNIVKKYI